MKKDIINTIISNFKKASKTDIKHGIIIAGILTALIIIKHFVWKALKILLRKIFLNGSTLTEFISVSVA